MSTLEFTATVNAAGQLDIPASVAGQLPQGAQVHVTVTYGAALRGTPGKNLLKFAGLISHSDLKQMSDAIAEGCEVVDANEWR